MKKKKKIKYFYKQYSINGVRKKLFFFMLLMVSSLTRNLGGVIDFRSVNVGIQKKINQSQFI